MLNNRKVSGGFIKAQHGYLRFFLQRFVARSRRSDSGSKVKILRVLAERDRHERLSSLFSALAVFLRVATHYLNAFNRPAFLWHTQPKIDKRVEDKRQDTYLMLVSLGRILFHCVQHQIFTGVCFRIAMVYNLVKLILDTEFQTNFEYGHSRPHIFDLFRPLIYTSVLFIIKKKELDDNCNFSRGKKDSSGEFQECPCRQIVSLFPYGGLRAGKLISVTSQIPKSLKLSDVMTFLEENDDKCPLVKNQHFVAIWGEILALSCSNTSIQSLLNFVMFRRF